MRAWRAYIETTSRVAAALEADLAPHGLTLGDYEVLAVLSDAPDQQMRMCDLAESLRLSASGLTRRLDGLVRSGVVERRACVSDRRVMHAGITPAGMRMLKRVAPLHVESVRRHLLDPLDRRDVRAMGEIFEKVRAGLLAEQASA
jgi:DNA-binding MarR family transcriptional regulator